MQGEKVPDKIKWMWQGSKTGDFAGVKRLIDEGVEVNHPYGDSSPLHAASAAGHFDIVKILLENGAVVNQPVDPWYEDNEEAGFSALHLAAREGHDKVVALLLQHKADPNKASWYPNLIRPIHVAQTPSSIKLLREYGADINAYTRLGPEEGGLTALHLAVKRSNKASVVALLGEGCRVDLEDKDKQTAVSAAPPRLRALMVKDMLQSSL